MPINFPLSAQYQISKPIQYVEEGTTGATYGIIPASPTFLLPGVVQDLSDTPQVESAIKRTVGQRNYYKNLLTKHRYTFELKFAPYSSTFLKYGSEAPVGAGTIAASLAFAKVQKINNAGTLADSYTFYKGCRPTSLDINIAGGIVEATMSFVAKEKTIPVFTANGGLTTPTWKEFADLTATPWTHLDGGADPLTIDGVTYPCQNFHINWNNNLSIDDVNGSEYIDENKAGNQDVTGDFTIFVGKDLALETDMKTNPMPAVAASYILKSATSTISITDLSIKQATDAQNSESSESYRIPFTFEAKSASIS